MDRAPANTVNSQLGSCFDERESHDDHVRSSIAWLKEGTDDMSILCQSLQPQQALIHTFIGNGGRRYDQQQLAKGAAATASAKAKIFTAHLRGCGVVFELLVQRSLGYPAQLFKLLACGDHAEEIMKVYLESPCLLDRFSFKHVQQYPSVEALRSTESLARLRAIAMLLKCHVHKVETTHSTNSQRARQRLGHSMSLSELAAWHQADVKLEALPQDHPSL